MLINWFGQSCFKFQGENTTLITDPFDKNCGLKLPRLAADIVTVSRDHDDHNNVSAVKGLNEPNPFVVTGPGEYEYRNVFIYGISSFHESEQGEEKGKNIIYRIEIDNISIGHLGDLGHTLSNGAIEKLEGLDILLIPVGGVHTIEAKQATEIISQLEPRIVIPMHYSIPGLKLKNKIDDEKKFCKEIGVCPKEKIEKFKITKKDLPQEDLQIVIFKP